MREKFLFGLIIIVFAAFLIAFSAEAKTLFEDDFSAGMENWEIVGPGEAEIKTDNSAPAEYGPKVLYMKETGTGSDLMAFAKDFTVTGISQR